MTKWDNIWVDGLMPNREIISGELFTRGEAQWDTEPDVDLYLSPEDPRYQACLKTAHTLRKQYPLEGLDPKNPDDLKRIVERESAITTALSKIMTEQYGVYNKAVASGADSQDHYTLHKDTKLANDDDDRSAAKLLDFKKNELICRHLMPLMAAFTTEAGMQIFYVGGINHDYSENKAGHIVADKPVTSDEASQMGYHAFGISRLSGNIIEASGSGNHAYKPNMNHLSIEDFMAGKTVYTSVDGVNYDSYGTGYTDSDEAREVFAQRKAIITTGHPENLPARQPDNYREDRVKNQLKQMQQSYDTQNLTLVHDEVKKTTQQFDSIVAKGVMDSDIPALQACCDKAPFDKASMARVLKSAVKTQQLAAANWAIDHGALQGFDDRVQKVDLVFQGDGATIKPEFASALTRKLGVTPESYFDHAVKSKWEGHIEAALSRIEQESPKSERLRGKLAAASLHLKHDFDNPGTPNIAESFSSSARPIDQFLTKHSQWNDSEPTSSPMQAAQSSGEQQGRGTKFSVIGAALTALVIGVANLVMGGGLFSGLALMILGGLGAGIASAQYLPSHEIAQNTPQKDTQMALNEKEPQHSEMLTAPLKHLVHERPGGVYRA